MNERNVLLLATSSQTKQVAWRELFDFVNMEINVLAPEDYGIEPIEVSERDDAEATYYDNALLKAMAYWHEHKVPVLADDSGVECLSLANWPGIITSRCADDSPLGVSEFIIQKMSNRTMWVERKAEYHTTAVFISREGHIFSCSMHRNGFIANEPSGNGNCVERIFIPDTQNLLDNPRTLGSLSSEKMYGQHFQTAFAYPKDKTFLPAFDNCTFLEAIKACVDYSFLMKKDKMSSDKYVEIRKAIMKLPQSSHYEFTVPSRTLHLLTSITKILQLK